MRDLHRTTSSESFPAKEMDSDDESLMDLDEKVMEFDSSWDTAFHWNESDLPSFTSSDATSDDVSMAETLLVSDMDASEEENGDLGDGDIGNGMLEDMHLRVIVRLVLLYVFGFDPLGGLYPSL